IDTDPGPTKGARWIRPVAGNRVADEEGEGVERHVDAVGAVIPNGVASDGKRIAEAEPPVTAVQHQHAGPAVRRKVAVEDGGGAVVEHQAVIGVPRGRAPVNAPVGALEENDSDSTDDPAAARADGAVAERGAASPLNRDAVPPARDRQPVEQKAVPRDR